MKITFEDDGKIRISPALPPAAYAPLGVNPGMTLIQPLTPAQKKYMEHHRTLVFKGM